MNQLKYIFSAFFVWPFLPLMYWQGKRIRQSVPKLPEAKEPSGKVENDHTHCLNLITIGESTIAGVGASTHQEGFSGTLAQALSKRLEVDIKWRVFAKSGYTAEKVSERLLPKMVGIEADLIVIGLGGNDAFYLNSPNRWRRGIKQLIVNLQKLYIGAPIVFINMPPIKNFPAFTPLIKFTVGNLVEMLGDELSSIAKDTDNVFYYGRRITFEDWNTRFGIAYEPEKYFSDGVHPALITYQIWAKDVADYIANDEALKNAIFKRQSP